MRVFDFFCGCGGAAAGLAAAGMRTEFGIDLAPDAAASYRLNFPGATTVTGDVRDLSARELRERMRRTPGPVTFCGCPPCQPFTKQNGSGCRPGTDRRRDLIGVFSSLVRACLPDLVFFENVPGLIGPRGGTRIKSLLAELREAGYGYHVDVVQACWYGVPQKRRRLVLLAVRGGRVRIPDAEYGPGTARPRYPDVRGAIERLPPLDAGQSDPLVPDHEAAKLSAENMRRMRATPPGGTRRGLAPDLKTRWQRTGRGYSDVRGRLRWDRPATGLTTRFGSFSNGRFGHPDQDRAITIREGAALQTLPDSFRVVGSAGSRTRQIGNAVPLLLAKAMGRALIRSLSANGGAAPKEPDGNGRRPGEQTVAKRNVRAAGSPVLEGAGAPTGRKRPA